MGLGPMSITGRIVTPCTVGGGTCTDKHENLTFFLKDICATERLLNEPGVSAHYIILEIKSFKKKKRSKF